MLTRIISGFLFASFLIESSFCQNGEVRVIRSVPTSSPIIDGILESEWWNAPAQGNFIQREPQEGALCSEATEIRVMHSPTALFVAFRCYDSEPTRIKSTLNKRDRISHSDAVYLGLDTYHDHRTAYYFGTNPHGVMADGIFFNDNQADDSWDGYWEVATTRDDSGWTAEFKIPFATLRFNNEIVDPVWGFIAERDIDRKKEETFWQEVPRDRGLRVSGFGHLEGLSNLKPGRGFELRPYAVANFSEEGPQPLKSENDWDNLGLDAKYRFLPNITIDATLNPDFAQIEADDEVINLSDYPVYLSEKRPFFLEGAGIFDSPWELFYSRRITDPEAGAKVSGKTGNTRFMAIAARNLNEDSQTEDFGVLRMKQDIFNNSDLGILLTDKEGQRGGRARVWSADSHIRIGDPWTITTQVAQSFKPEMTRDNWAYYLLVDYQSDRYSGSAWAEAMMPDFRGNDAGWISYTDFQRTGAWLQYAPRPEKWGIRHVWHNFNLGVETQYDFTHYERWGNYNNSFQMMNYMYFGFGSSYSESYRRHYVDEDENEPYTNTDNFGGYNLEHYKSWWQWIWYETDFSKPLAISLSYNQGDYRDGYERDFYGTLQVQPRDNLVFQLQEQYAHVNGTSDVNDGAPSDFLVERLKMELTLSLNVFTRLNVQYTNDEGAYLTNFLVGYKFAPESYLYFVYDDQRSEFLGWQTVTDRKIKMKVSYFLQI